AKYKGKSEADLKESEEEDYANYKKYREIVENARSKEAKSIERYASREKQYDDADNALKAHYKGDYTAKDAKSLMKDDTHGEAANLMYPLKKAGATVENVKEQLKGGVEHFQSQLDYHYNVDYNPRAIIGDNPANFSDKYCGNNNVEGPDAFHGTHVAGIIAATRG